jgi:hypothetical protein
MMIVTNGNTIQRVVTERSLVVVLTEDDRDR